MFCAGCWLWALPALAQDADPALRAHRFTVLLGGSWVGGYPIGENTALIRSNQPGTLTPEGIPLFHAESSFEHAFGTEARVGFALTRTLAVEAGASFAQPNLAVDISQDSESGPVRIADEHVTEFIIDLNVNWQVPGFRVGPHGRPYVLAGGGYLRQLYEDRIKVETGSVAYVGGGVRYWFRGGDATHRALGLRAEARLLMRRGGIDLANDLRSSPVINLFGFLGF